MVQSASKCNSRLYCTGVTDYENGKPQESNAKENKHH